MALVAMKPAMTREHLQRAGRAAICRGRRPALVAATFGSGRAHAHFRRSDLARLCRRALCPRDRRCCGAERGDPFPGRITSAGRRTRQLLSPDGVGRGRHAVRAVRPRPRYEPRGRHSWSAANWHRRLERRYEPCRRTRPGRERPARLAAVRGTQRVRSSRRGTRSHGSHRGVANARRPSASCAGTRGLGRRVIPSPGSTTAPLFSVQQPTRSAELIPFRNRGVDLGCG
jgi:hypothetical protein